MATNLISPLPYLPYPDNLERPDENCPVCLQNFQSEEGEGLIVAHPNSELREGIKLSIPPSLLQRALSYLSATCSSRLAARVATLEEVFVSCKIHGACAKKWLFDQDPPRRNCLTCAKTIDPSSLFSLKENCITYLKNTSKHALIRAEHLVKESTQKAALFSGYLGAANYLQRAINATNKTTFLSYLGLNTALIAASLTSFNDENYRIGLALPLISFLLIPAPGIWNAGLMNSLKDASYYTAKGVTEGVLYGFLGGCGSSLLLETLKPISMATTFLSEKVERTAQRIDTLITDKRAFLLGGLATLIMHAQVPSEQMQEIKKGAFLFTCCELGMLMGSAGLKQGINQSIDLLDRTASLTERISRKISGSFIGFTLQGTLCFLSHNLAMYFKILPYSITWLKVSQLLGLTPPCIGLAACAVERAAIWTQNATVRLSARVHDFFTRKKAVIGGAIGCALAGGAALYTLSSQPTSSLDSLLNGAFQIGIVTQLAFGAKYGARVVSGLANRVANCSRRSVTFLDKENTRKAFGALLGISITALYSNPLLKN